MEYLRDDGVQKFESTCICPDQVIMLRPLCGKGMSDRTCYHLGLNPAPAHLDEVFADLLVGLAIELVHLWRLALLHFMRQLHTFLPDWCVDAPCNDYRYLDSERLQFSPQRIRKT